MESDEEILDKDGKVVSRRGKVEIEKDGDNGDDKDTAKSGEVLIERVSLALQLKSLTLNRGLDMMDGNA